MQIPFVGGSGTGRSLNIDASRSINFYVESSPTQDAKTLVALIGTPGTKTFIDFTSGQIRLVYNYLGRLFVVVGDTLYEVFSNGFYSAPLGVFPDSAGTIVAADNGTSTTGSLLSGGDQIIFVTNGKGYIFNVASSVFTLITDIGFPPDASGVTYLAGYFVVTNNTQNYYCSALYDGLTYPGLAFDVAKSTSDSIQTPVALHQQLYLIKEVATEVWYPAGVPTSQGSPFIQMPSTMIEFGTPAPRSVAKGASTIFFLANILQGDFGAFAGVVLLNGYSAEIISTPAINYRISKFKLSSAFGYCYADEGHIFYVLTFPDNDATFVYDGMTKMWHERSSASSTDANIHRHLSNGYTFVFGKHLVPDYRSSKLVEMSSAYYDEDGTEIVSIRTAQPIYEKSELGQIYIHKLVVDIEAGGGTDSIAPQAWLSWSNDGGHTWSSEYSASMGSIGNFKKRLMWPRLGRARDRVFKLRMPDAAKKIILGASVNDGVLG